MYIVKHIHQSIAIRKAEIKMSFSDIVYWNFRTGLCIWAFRNINPAEKFSAVSPGGNAGIPGKVLYKGIFIGEAKHLRNVAQTVR